MRFLFCCEFYFPSVGGVQEVVRQVAEHLVSWGHEVTVATTRLSTRDFTEHNGVRIVEFGAAGNLVRGMSGEIESYRKFVINFPCDALMIKAAQQWTFDALWPVLDNIKARKVFIPCGFSGLYEPAYSDYFVDIVPILRKFDHLIFYADQYRDTNFARQHGLTSYSIIPNGASEIDFAAPIDKAFRDRYHIPKDAFLMLTVGSLTGVKGHQELAESFERLQTNGREAVLILNGNPPPSPTIAPALSYEGTEQSTLNVFRAHIHTAIKPFIKLKSMLTWYIGLTYRSYGVFRREGLSGIQDRLSLLLYEHQQMVYRILKRLGIGVARARKPLDQIIQDVNASGMSTNKQILVTDLPRNELVQAFKAADLFVFASNIEYSPLVLYEAAAAGTPFLSVPVGNAEEIAEWTGAGIICPAAQDGRGYTRVSPDVMAAHMAHWMQRSDKLAALGKYAEDHWMERFSWAVIVRRYEAILMDTLSKDPQSC